MSNKAEHETVLLEEAVAAMITEDDGLYVDGTFGRGGHSRAVLSRLSDKGSLLAIDKDPTACHQAKQMFAGDSRFEIVHGSFAELAQVVADRCKVGQVQGVLLDLGVSSPQLDDPLRGFSFLRDGPLDMRMNPAVGESAAEWLARAEEAEITQVLRVYGEERFARRMAKAVVEARQEKEITRTGQLAEIIAAANPAWEKGKHPATRAFQAIRIFINHELDDLQEVLVGALGVLANGGRLVVISFHSLEDRIVKRFMREQAQGKPIPRGMPVMEKDIERRMRLIGKAVKPGSDEINLNPRARSAVMRVAEKVA